MLATGVAKIALSGTRVAIITTNGGVYDQDSPNPSSNGWGAQIGDGTDIAVTA